MTLIDLARHRRAAAFHFKLQRALPPQTWCDRLEPRAETICLEKERAFREYELIYEGLK